MERFGKIINDFQPLTIFSKRSILDILIGFWIRPWLISERIV